MDLPSSPVSAPDFPGETRPLASVHGGPAKLPSCGGCPLERSGPFVPGEGSGASGMLLLGEAPGEQEVKLARPFVGPAGAQLDHLLRLAGLERPSLRLTNAVHSRPPKNELSGTAYEAEVIARCGGFLDHEISVFRPRVIVALGNIPLKAARARHEDPVSITRARGFILDSRWMDPATGRPIPLVPTFHPSFLLPRRGEQSSSKWTGAVVLDLRKAARIAREGWERKPVSYLLDPPPAVASAFASEVEAAFATGRASVLAFDIETVASGKLSEEERLILEDQVITRISFAAEPRRAITLPWQAPWMGVIERLLRSAVPKVGWNNHKFDVPVLERHGVSPLGEIFDGMLAWKVLQPSLPAGLEPTSSFYCDWLRPWKHESGSAPQRYSCMDADATVTNWIGIRRDLEANVVAA